MILILRILCMILLALGIWKMAASVLLLPTKEVRSRIRNPNGKPSTDEQLRSALRSLTKLLEKHLPVGEYKLHRLQMDFDRLGMTESPRQFLAFAMARSIAVGLLGLSFILLGIPWLSLITVVLATLMYAQSSQNIRNKVQKLNRRIEAALPRMVDTMEHTLKGDRDLITFFRRYRKSAGTALGRELDVLIADMQTGNQEMALKRMDTRIGSANFSALIAILCGVSQGIDQRTSLAILASDLRTRERERLKKQLDSNPGRIKGASLVLTFTMVGMFMVPLIMMVIETLSATGF